jgi:hypothetical protein
MGKENSTIKMEACMMVIGRITRWKGLGLYIINQENLLIKGCGNKINSKAKANFTINTHILYKEILIIKILIKLMSIGLTMKVQLI